MGWMWLGMGEDRSLGDGVRYRRAPTELIIKTCPHNFQSDNFHTVKRSPKICWKDWSAKSSIFKKYFHHALWNTQPGTRKKIVFWISCVTPVLILITPKLPLKTCGIWLNFQIITDFEKSVRIWLKHAAWHKNKDCVLNIFCHTLLKYSKVLPR